MANLNVTYDQLESTSARLRSGQQELETKLQELRRLTTELVSNGFTTTRASGAFDAAYQEFTVGAERAVSGIESMAQFLTNAASVLRDTDEQLARTIGTR